MRNKHFRLLTRSLLILGFLTACTPMPLTNQTSVSAVLPTEPKQNPFQAGFTPEQIHQRQEELARFRQKAPFTGPIQVKVDTGLIQSGGTSGRVVDLSGYVVQQASSFSIQAVPTGPVVFQERFTKGQAPLEVTRTFPATNLSSRYTLHVQKLASAGDDGHVEVNINGTNWILERDFDHQELEVQRDALLLNSNNSLRVRIKGKPGLSVIVTVVEGGQAGTILRRQGKLGLPGETQLTHLRQNDVNIFDPSDPNSLGGLQPYEGVEKVDTGQKVYEFSEWALNGVSVRIENGRLLMVFKDEARKQAFLAAYHAEVESEEYGACLIKFDLSRAPLQNLDELIRFANTRMAANITEVSMSSFDGLRTFALLLDVLKNHSDDFLFADPNFKQEGSQVSPPAPVQPADWNDGFQSWWLKDTKVLNAWNYSIGTGVRVAWLDMGTNFTNLFHPELVRRTDQNYLANDNLSLTDTAALFNNHALFAQMVGFAERDNQIRTVGVSPDSTLISYSVLTHWDKTDASFKAVYKGHANVIGSSYGCFNCRDDVFRFFENVLGGGTALDYAINWIVNGLQIPYVNSAGNGGSQLSPSLGIPVSKNIPNGNTPNLIMAGAVVPPDTRAFLKYASAPGRYEATYYSNFGDNVIYVPGEGIWVSKKTPDANLEYFNGTSAAAPFLTGVVALMLSRNPNLTPAQILDILKNSSKTGSSSPVFEPNPDPNFPPGPILFTFPSYASRLNLKLIDVEEAVKQAITAGSHSLKLPNEYFGLVSVDNGGNKRLFLNRYSEPAAPGSERIKSLDLQTVSGDVWSGLKNGAVVKVKGWSDIPIGKAYVFPTAYLPKPLQDPLPIFPVSIVANVPAGSLETLDVQPVCDLSKGPGASGFYEVCPTPPAGFSPAITGLNIKQSGASNLQTFTRAADVEIEVQGQNLWMNSTSSIANAVLTLHQVDGSGNPVNVPGTTTPNTSTFNIHPTSVSNDGTSLKFSLSSSDLTAKITTTGNYKMSLTTLTGQTPLVGFSSSSNFTIASQGGGSSNCEQWSMRVYNVDDKATATVNLNNVLNVSYHGDSGFVPINNYLQPGSNQVHFTLFNADGGYTWGFQLKKNDQIVYQNEAGQVGVIGANNNDLSKPNQVVFDHIETITANACAMSGLPVLREVQSLPTTGSSRFAAFAIGNDSFLAVTNAYDQPPPRYDLSVNLYKWNGSQFSAFQSIPAQGPFAVEPFTIGTDHFLAIAEYYHTLNNTFDFNSHLYKWDGSQFVPYQEIPTHGATGWKHFTIGMDDYLVVANHVTGSGCTVCPVQIDSVLYKWNGSQFVSVQNLPTTAARDWEHIQIGNDHFLAVANEYDGSSYNTSTNIYSEIFKWDGNRFNSFQKVHSEGARDWKAFTIGNRSFLALANLWGATNSPGTAEKPKVYEWNGSQFTVVQEFDTSVLSWDHVEMNNKDYLLSSGWDSGGTQMYLWNGAQWDPYQALVTPGAYDALFFTIGGVQYYATVSITYAFGSYHADSKVYRFE